VGIDMDLIKKVLGGVAIAAVSGAVTWSYSIGARTAVMETTLSDHYTDILQTQAVMSHLTSRVDGVEKTVLSIFNEMKMIQQEQVNISKTLTQQVVDQGRQLESFRGTLDGIERDVDYIKAYEDAEDTVEKNAKVEPVKVS